MPKSAAAGGRLERQVSVHSLPASKFRLPPAVVLLSFVLAALLYQQVAHHDSCAARSLLHARAAPE